MQISDAECGYDLRIRPRLDGRPRPRQPDGPIHKRRAARAQEADGHRALGDLVEAAAVDRLSRDTTDLLVLAMLANAATLERRWVIKSTARGRADANADGVQFGRKPKPLATSRARRASAQPPATTVHRWGGPSVREHVYHQKIRASSTTICYERCCANPKARRGPSLVAEAVVWGIDRLLRKWGIDRLSRKKYKPTDEQRKEAKEELEAAATPRAHDLWVEAGQPDDRSPRDFLKQAKYEFYYYVDHNVDHNVDAYPTFVYRKSSTANLPESLSLLKDWVTSVIQLETAALAVFGFAAGFKEVFSAKATDAPGSGPVAAITNLDKMFASTELLFLLLSGLSIVWSIVNGIYLLNALPGAAQRVAANATARRSDIYSVRNDDGQDSISEMTSRFRWLFILGITLFAVFAAIRIIERFIRVIYS